MVKALTMAFILTYSIGLFAQTKATQKLFKAIHKNDLVLARNAVKDGADVNGVDNLKAPVTTVLLKAIELKRYEIVDLLLLQNADVNQRRPSDFYTGLMMASEMNDVKLAEMLLVHSTDVTLDTLNGLTALHLAARNNSLEVARLLIKAKEIDVNAGGENCALYVSAKEGFVGMSLLLKTQIGAKATNPMCLEKAIMIAKKNEFDDVVRILSRN